MGMGHGRRRARAFTRLSMALGVSTLGLAGLGLSATSALVPAASATQMALHPNHFTGKPTGGGSSALGWASSNWSGYAVTSPTPYSAVTAQWTVPSVTPSSGGAYSAAWVGIDGFNNNSLIQTGTEQDYYSGTTHYTAWWTTSAQNFIEQPISEPVLPGDHMTASITETNVATSAWTIALSDTTRGWNFSHSVTYTGPRASAEWIMEAPTIGGRIAPVAHYASPTTFDPSTANGVSPGFVASNGGEMVQGPGRHGQVVSIPSIPDSGVNEADGFNISYGSTAPAAPAS